MCVLLDTATYYIKQNHLLSRCILQDIKNILPLLAGTRILCLTVTNAFHKFQESCLPGGILLEDTGVFKHMAEHNTDLIPQNSLGFFTLQAGAVLLIRPSIQSACTASGLPASRLVLGAEPVRISAMAAL